MARPIPDDRVEEERRKLRFHQMRSWYRGLLWNLRIDLIFWSFLAAVFGLAMLVWLIQRMLSR
jgi:hypothetical protein